MSANEVPAKEKEIAAKDKVLRVLIVGLSSYNGAALAIGLKDEYEVFGTYHDHPIRIEGVTALPLDCRNGGDIVEVMRRVKPDAVIYAIGFHDLVIAKDNAGLAETLNAKAPTLFFKALATPPLFIYLSRDEANDPNRNVITRTKRQGETTVLGHRKYAFVVRVGKVFGEPVGGLSFLAEAWTEKPLQHLQHGRTAAASTSEIHSHTYVGDVIRAMKLLLARPPADSVLFEIGAPDALSNFDFMQKLATALELNPALVQGQVTAIEKINSAVKTTAFCNAYPFQFQSIEHGIKEYIERMRTGLTRPWL